MTARVPSSLARVGTMKAAKKAGRFPVSSVENRTVDGIVFDSAKEARRYAELKILQRAGKIADLTPQVALDVNIDGKHYCRFTVDFSYREPASADFIYEEVKSSGTAKDSAYRLRRKAAELFHGIQIREVVL